MAFQGLPVRPKRGFKQDNRNKTNEPPPTSPKSSIASPPRPSKPSLAWPSQPSKPTIKRPQPQRQPVAARHNALSSIHPRSLAPQPEDADIALFLRKIQEPTLPSPDLPASSAMPPLPTFPDPSLLPRTEKGEMGRLPFLQLTGFFPDLQNPDHKRFWEVKYAFGEEYVHPYACECERCGRRVRRDGGVAGRRRGGFVMETGRETGRGVRNSGSSKERRKGGVKSKGKGKGKVGEGRGQGDEDRPRLSRWDLGNASLFATNPFELDGEAPASGGRQQQDISALEDILNQAASYRRARPKIVQTPSASYATESHEDEDPEWAIHHPFGFDELFQDPSFDAVAQEQAMASATMNQPHITDVDLDAALAGGESGCESSSSRKRRRGSESRRDSRKKRSHDDAELEPNSQEENYHQKKTRGSAPAKRTGSRKGNAKQTD